LLMEKGGIEYPMFWCLVCIALSMLSWQ